MDKISGGYILQPRCIEDSWIAHAAPVVRETWFFLLRNANHTDKKYNGFIVKRGQLFLSYREIRDALSWKKGYRTMRYSEDQMKHGMKLLRTHLMITLTSAPRGNLITICNYDKYQTPKNYECTNEYPNEYTNDTPIVHRTSPPINKNEKKLRMKEKRLAQFETFWNTYNKKIDRKKCFAKFMNLSAKDIKVIMESVDNYVKAHPETKYRKNPLTYLNGECWNDEIKVKPTKTLASKAF